MLSFKTILLYIKQMTNPGHPFNGPKRDGNDPCNGNWELIKSFECGKIWELEPRETLDSLFSSIQAGIIILSLCFLFASILSLYLYSLYLRSIYLSVLCSSTFCLSLYNYVPLLSVFLSITMPVYCQLTKFYLNFLLPKNGLEWDKILRKSSVHCKKTEFVSRNYCFCRFFRRQWREFVLIFLFYVLFHICWECREYREEKGLERSITMPTRPQERDRIWIISYWSVPQDKPSGIFSPYFGSIFQFWES